MRPTQNQRAMCFGDQRLPKTRALAGREVGVYAPSSSGEVEAALTLHHGQVELVPHHLLCEIVRELEVVRAGHHRGKRIRHLHGDVERGVRRFPDDGQRGLQVLQASHRQPGRPCDKHHKLPLLRRGHPHDDREQVPDSTAGAGVAVVAHREGLQLLHRNWLRRPAEHLVQLQDAEKPHLRDGEDRVEALCEGPHLGRHGTPQQNLHRGLEVLLQIPHRHRLHRPAGPKRDLGEPRQGEVQAELFHRRTIDSQGVDFGPNRLSGLLPAVLLQPPLLPNQGPCLHQEQVEFRLDKLDVVDVQGEPPEYLQEGHGERDVNDSLVHHCPSHELPQKREQPQHLPVGRLPGVYGRRKQPVGGQNVLLLLLRGGVWRQR
eukprot:RCo016965